jgi:lipopolysaccharide/colanic/teichoic acid biosynthesis glycosyltransferase
MQRFFDVFLSGITLMALSPLLLPLIIILKCTGEGMVFFKGARVGKDYKMFQILKFSTMLKDSPNMATGTLTIGNDPRILPVGKLLRRFKINELPQLINVFLGDMSLVGPRPQSKRNFDAFHEEVRDAITLVRPGLTGLGSLVFRDEESILSDVKDPDDFYDSVVMPYKGALEHWYVEHKSFALYLKIIFVTFYGLVLSRPIHLFEIFTDIPRPNDKNLDFLN